MITAAAVGAANQGDGDMLPELIEDVAPAPRDAAGVAADDGAGGDAAAGTEGETSAGTGDGDPAAASGEAWRSRAHEGRRQTRAKSPLGRSSTATPPVAAGPAWRGWRTPGRSR